MNAFTTYLISEGYNLKLYDIDCSKAQALAEKKGCQWSNSLHSVIADTDVAFLCIPIRETPKTVRRITPYMKNGSILCEIASLKAGTVAALRKAKEHGVRPLSVHPMFGPDIKVIEGQTVVVVPVIDRVEEARMARSLFPDTKNVVVDAEIHDRCMASILALPYFMNMAFACALSSENLSLMKELAGTTFTVQLAVAQSIVGESPELIESLIRDNVFSEEMLIRFIDESKHIMRLLKNDPHGFRNLCENLNGSMMQSDVLFARGIRNELFEKVKSRS